MHSWCRPKEQAGANRPSNRHHRHLPRMKLMVQALFCSDFILSRHPALVSESYQRFAVRFSGSKVAQHVKHAL
jgi:hypothetical protein